jgi:site-specific DNA-adenine methylase
MKIINKALFSYFGNKDRESKQIMENLPDMNNIDIIIEPYCGSFSLIRNLILLYPDKKYICVDNDKKLIQAYNDIIDDDKYNKILNNLKNTEIKTKEEYDIYRKINTTESYIYYHSIYTIRHGLFNRKKSK